MARIVVGVDGSPGAINALLLASVRQEVAPHASCAVVIVPPPADEE